jgi:hypothetical protein
MPCFSVDKKSDEQDSIFETINQKEINKRYSCMALA